jgi:hypothetical protein
MGNFGLTEIGLILTLLIIFAVVFLLVPYWRIYYLAFAEWPSLRRWQQSQDVGTPVS